jgi:predicted ATPase
MRKPDRFHTDPHVTVNGGHLPATIHRLASDAKRKGREPEDVYADVAARLSELVSVSGVNVLADEVRQLLTLEVTEASGVRLPANSLSDGTLRFLALAIIAADPGARGLMCMEEPENGIHPAKIGAMVDLLREIAVDTNESPGEDNPLRQVVVATHSPAFVQLQNRDDLVFALEATVRTHDGLSMELLRCLPLADTWRATQTGQGVGRATILAYLTAPPDSQLSLASDDEVINRK